MLHDLTRAVSQLGDRRFLLVFCAASVITLLLFAGLGWGLKAGLDSIDPSGWPSWLAKAWVWLDDALALLGTFAALWFLFPAIATTVMAAFLDPVVDAVEDKHYPSARAPRPLGLLEGAKLGLLSGARLIGWNLLFLPLYLLLLFTAIGPLLLFLAVNGWLLGRDFWQMVAIRHLDGTEAALRAGHRREIFGFGLLLSLMFLIPLVNLVAPLLGAAMATHGVHRALAGRRDAVAGSQPL
jgi:CysZ protein